MADTIADRLRALSYTVVALQGQTPESQLLNEAAAENERLIKGIKDFLSGAYDNPSTYRPNACQHGIGCNSSCTFCDVAHFTAILGNVKP